MIACSFERLFELLKKHEYVRAHLFWLITTGRYKPQEDKEIEKEAKNLFRKNGYVLNKYKRRNIYNNLYQSVYYIRSMPNGNKWPCGISKKQYNKVCYHHSRCYHGRSDTNLKECELARKTKEKEQKILNKYRRIK